MRQETRPIRYTKHARDQMKARRISQAEVEQTIRAGAWHPDGIDKWVASGFFDGRRIDIAFVETEDGEVEILLVVTVIDKAKGWR